MCFSAVVAKVKGEDVIKSDFLDITKITELDYPKDVKTADSNGRFYPKTWAPLLVKEDSNYFIKPMRYQLLPHFAKTNRYTRENPKTGRQVEIKNTFNARRDKLLERKAWKNLFGHKHAVIPLDSFYEWVEDKGANKLIRFSPQSRETLWVACLWDHWQDSNEAIDSFAIVTDEPYAEVLEKGHDRTPVILAPEAVMDWLNPEGKNRDQLNEVLDRKNKIYLEGQFT